MRYAIILLAVAATLTLGGTFLSQNEGSVTLNLSNGSYEMPLWYFLVAVALFVIVLMVAFKLLWGIIRLPATFKNWTKKRRNARANTLLQKGLLAMEKGNWKKAEKLLVKGSALCCKTKADASLFLTNAAQAAHEQGSFVRRDDYLLEARQLAVEVESTDSLATALKEARLYLSDNKPQQALTALQAYRQQHSDNSQFREIEMQAHEQLGNHHEVWHLLSLMKGNFKDKESYLERKAEVAKKLFVAEGTGLDMVEKVWSELPKSAKSDEGVFLSYVSGLVQYGEEEKAEKLLSKAIRKSYADPLIHAYTQLETGSSTARLATMKKWLRQRPENAYLNYGAAKAAFQSEQFEEAKQYAETSLKSMALPETFALLGKIYEALNEESNALKAYKGSVSLIYANQPEAISGNILPQVATVAALPEVKDAQEAELLDDEAKSGDKETEQSEASAKSAEEKAAS